MAFTTLAFGFLPTGGFAIGNHSTFDRNIPHKFITVQAVHQPMIFTNEGVTCTSQTVQKAVKSKRNRTSKASKVAVPKRPQKVTKVAKVATSRKLPTKGAFIRNSFIARGHSSVKPKKITKQRAYTLTGAERRQGWQLPSLKHTARRMFPTYSSKVIQTTTALLFWLNSLAHKRKRLTGLAQ